MSMPRLDWRDRSHWNGGRTEPCRICGRGCWTLDDAGRVVHKSCVEHRLPDDPDEEPTPPWFDLAGIIASLGGHCLTCGLFPCGCEAEP